MLDVHAPHERMEGVSDFLLHLLTITVGLLIALSLEGLVEWRHHVHLVDEARTTMRAEIARNAQDLDKNVAVMRKQRNEINANLDYLAKVQTNPKDEKSQHGSLTANYSIFDLRDTAWKTAQSTGALTLCHTTRRKGMPGCTRRRTALKRPSSE
jgi:hypothetical protein